MKTRLLVVAVVIVATSVTIGAQTSRSTLEEAVWKADAAWADASASNNVDRMLAFYDVNAAFIGTTPPTAVVSSKPKMWEDYSDDDSPLNTNFWARPCPPAV